jgi:predicted RNase H-like HicB family nuclease
MKNNTPSYPISIFWSHEDDAYIAMAPDLEGCSAGGATAVEALQELQVAMALWLEAAQKIGKPLPKPSLPTAPWSVRKHHQPHKVAAIPALYKKVV